MIVVVGAYSVQSGWKSVEASDVTPLGQACEVEERDGLLYRYAYYVEGQTYYHDACRPAGVQAGVRVIAYDPQDPYNAAISDTDTFKYAGIALAAVGLMVTIVALFARAKPHHS